jgi:hypothetical protein
LDSVKNRKSNKAIVNIVETILAEGVVSEPFLPSGDQGHKGGFAALTKQHPITRNIANKTPHEIELFTSNFGRKTRREPGHS